MYYERIDHHPGSPSDYSDGYQSGGGRHRAPAEVFSDPLIPPDSGWDPAEELAFMLRDAIEEQQPIIPVIRNEESLTTPDSKTHREALEEITAELPPLPKLPPLKGTPRGHRKVRERQRLGAIRTASYLIAALATVIASAVSFFGGMIAYDPLQFIAVSRTQSSVASWWPLLVFGPWLVASLSILRAALHQRRASHSWCVVVLFSSIAIALCVAQAPKNVVDTAAAALPSLASLACFQQLVRQITLSRPPLRTLPRHRLQRAETPTDEASAGPMPRAGTALAGGGLT
ncbi:DUF2637 domain-containing protein [Streptomyces sp. NPDC018833]|uniref:DUF2637 domain-containing protein n=1 Tax=Streptomyces sp. NPDC018833 TaxID=3365053 RepID=UPI0037B8B64F